MQKRLPKDFLILILIICLPTLLYIYLLFPSEKDYNFGLFTFKSKYYTDVETMVWVVMIKIAFLVTYCLWFVTCKHWWRYAILVPILFSINQLIVVVNSELYYVDNYELLSSVVLAVPIISILFLISKKLNYYKESENLLININEEMNIILNKINTFEKHEFKKVQKEFNQIKNNKKDYSEEEYLAKLHWIRQQLLINTDKS